MWMPALLLASVVPSCQKIIFGCGDRGGGPCGPAGTQLAALRWVQLVGVRGLSIHAGLKQVHQRAAESISVNPIYEKQKYFNDVCIIQTGSPAKVHWKRILSVYLKKC